MRVVPKILLVEDDLDLSATIVLALKAEMHVIDAVYRGDDALHMLAINQYDVIVLDLELPEVNGLEILRRFRSKGGVTPIIILTGQNHINEKEAGLDAGADDYQTKPFSVRELSARIRALLRRPAAVVTNVLIIDDITIDRVGSSVTKAGVEIRLKPCDFALLEFFMRHPGEVFSTQTLLDRVWQSDSDGTPEGLRTAISRIRKALDPDDAELSMIENLPKFGYRLRSKGKR